jgi:hypothetical protein
LLPRHCTDAATTNVGELPSAAAHYEGEGKKVIALFAGYFSLFARCLFILTSTDV